MIASVVQRTDFESRDLEKFLLCNFSDFSDMQRFHLRKCIYADGVGNAVDHKFHLRTCRNARV